MDDLISVGLYRLMNRFRPVGNAPTVRMRRMVMNLQHEMANVRYNLDPLIEAWYLSGSEAEGLRFPSSDRDIMFVIRDVRVIYSCSKVPPHSNTVLLAECDSVRPGFALLRLVTNATNYPISISCVRLHNSYFVSNILWKSSFRVNIDSENIHGPCISGIVGNTEYDFACCIKSDTWPDAALGCVRRLRHAGWPSHEVLSKIINEGCLFVPIGSKNSPCEEYEWRLSFSLAEKRLVHSMTHNQFVTYGLLKIFLKEAIDVNLEVKGLLCSYFLKTILFWKIIQEKEWREENFLRNFWKCFESLITCVISGNCPNFFIPENNMFTGKIEGEAQRKLLSYLTFLHNIGYRCLLRCPSLQDMSTICQQPLFALRLPDDQSTSERICLELILEICNMRFPLDHKQEVNLALLLQAESLLSNCSSEGVSFVVKTWVKMFLPMLCASLAKQNQQRYNTSHKMHYKTERFIMQVIMSSSCDSVSHLIYAAIALYHFGYFAAAINIIRQVKIRLQHPYLMHSWYLNVHKYRAAGGENTSISNMMKSVIAFSVCFSPPTCIPELELEHEAARHIDNGIITIPPLVIADALSFLCNLHEQNFQQARTVLDELSALVHRDNGFHIHNDARAISWQLLGICQEMSGHYQRAYHSYCAAVQQRWCPIRSASELRIRNMLSYLSYHYNN